MGYSKWEEEDRDLEKTGNVQEVPVVRKCVYNGMVRGECRREIVPRQVSKLTR